jgi:hypothetical protein
MSDGNMASPTTHEATQSKQIAADTTSTMKSNSIERTNTSPACLFIHHIRGMLPIISNKYNSTNYKR